MGRLQFNGKRANKKVVAMFSAYYIICILKAVFDKHYAPVMVITLIMLIIYYISPLYANKLGMYREKIDEMSDSYDGQEYVKERVVDKE